MVDCGLLLPADMLNERIVDPEFNAESSTARYLPFSTSLVVQETLTAGSSSNAVFKRLPESGSELVYRGWMLTPGLYQSMFCALSGRGLTLRTTPDQYEAAHLLPGWLEVFKGMTPRSAVLSEHPTHEELLRAGESLGCESFIVKDFVKSRKHEWATACFAPTLEALPAIVDEFVRLQEDFLVGGVVVREFVQLDKSTPEARIWWVNGSPVLTTVHPDNAGEQLVAPPELFLAQVEERVQELGCFFITTDAARLSGGSWCIIEVGDGQVSGLPSSIEDEELEALLTAVTA